MFLYETPSKLKKKKFDFLIQTKEKYVRFKIFSLIHQKNTKLFKKLYKTAFIIKKNSKIPI